VTPTFCCIFCRGGSDTHLVHLCSVADFNGFYLSWIEGQKILEHALRATSFRSMMLHAIEAEHTAAGILRPRVLMKQMVKRKQPRACSLNSLVPFLLRSLRDDLSLICTKRGTAGQRVDGDEI
jgi:hypothetical protein